MKLGLIASLGKRWLLVLATLLLGAGGASAQDMDNRAPIALLGGMLLFFWICAIAGYIYFALALQTIANKTNTENAWLAWIPIANIILMLNIARKPIWWIILFLIPLVNLVMAIIVWMGIAEARNKPSWWGILLIVPLVNVIVPGYLAWSD
jgi:dolichyl-phosphate-mannose--protein O-mannosyl transferase